MYSRFEDREFFDRELSSFVPDRVFDGHCHLWTADRFGSGSTVPEGLRGDVGLREYREAMKALLPERRVSALFIPSVREKKLFPEANRWTAEQGEQDPDSRYELRVHPEDDPEQVRDLVRQGGYHGLKCYHLSSNVMPSWNADIPDYLPERLVKVAHEEELVITLHMVKERALADPTNLHWIRHYCTRYPRMTLILAHSARGFQPAHNLEALPQVKDLENLYFDTSANCEPLAHESIIKIIGHRKLMYGSDFFVSHLRGRSLSVADTFLWLYEESPVWSASHQDIKPVLVGLEHLRSLKWACWSAGLGDSQVEDIFWNNAARLFRISP